MLNVMIVDDEVRTRRVLIELIDWVQLDAKPVVIASNGLEAIDALKNNTIDVIISDIRMPFVDGLELAKFVKTNNLNIRIILISAYAEFEYAQAAMRYGVTDYILKPLNTKKLKEISDIIKSMHSQKLSASKNFILFNSPEFILNLKNNILSMNEQDAYNITSEYSKNLSDGDNNIKDYYSCVLYICIQIAHEKNIDTTDFEHQLKILDTTPDLDYSAHIKKSISALIDALKIKQLYEVNTKLDIQNVINYISVKISDYDLSASKIAEHFNVSLSYLCNEFKRCTNTTLSETIVQLRMENAASLLVETTMPIHNISIFVGYNNTKYFNKLFKRYYGVTPSDYRNRGGKM